MRKGISTFFIICIFISTCAVWGYAAQNRFVGATVGYTAYDVTRLHIVGADNSSEAQRMKLELRDKMCAFFEEMFADCETKADFDARCIDDAETIESVANEYLRELGADYGATVDFGKSYFPMRLYGDIVLPSGVYDAVQIVLGEGLGNNWWCILFPRRCYGESENKTVRYRSRIAEWFSKRRNKKRSD